MALRNNAAPKRRAKLASRSNSTILLDKMMRCWRFLAGRRRVGVSFARSLARKEAQRSGLAALAAWRLEVALDLQHSACERFVSGENARERTFAALCALRRSMVRRFYSVFDLWYKTARQEKCFRRLCSVKVPATDNGLQYRILLKTQAWAAGDERALRRQLRHDIAGLMAHLCIAISSRKDTFPRVSAGVEEQVLVGSVLHLSSVEAEDYMRQAEEQKRDATEHMSSGHLEDFRQLNMRRYPCLRIELL